MTGQRLYKAAAARLYLGLTPHGWRKVAASLPKVYLPGLARPLYDVQALDAMIAGNTGKVTAKTARQKALEAVERW